MLGQDFLDRENLCFENVIHELVSLTMLGSSKSEFKDITSS